MELNADFDVRVAVHAASLDWIASPMAGVDRRMLDRLGDEVARATTIVRYAPESQFSPHVHTGGEEFLVLDGVFQDEHGDFPVGTYVRNPPESSHTPGSAPGCVIFVKLWQFDMADRTQVRIDTNTTPYHTGSGARRGRDHAALPGRQRGCPPRAMAGDTTIPVDAPNGIEILVLDGGFDEGGDTFVAQSWLRLPKGSRATVATGSSGARVWIKRDHLATPPTPPQV